MTIDCASRTGGKDGVNLSSKAGFSFFSRLSNFLASKDGA